MKFSVCDFNYMYLSSGLALSTFSWVSVVDGKFTDAVYYFIDHEGSREADKALIEASGLKRGPIQRYDFRVVFNTYLSELSDDSFAGVLTPKKFDVLTEAVTINNLVSAASSVGATFGCAADIITQEELDMFTQKLDTLKEKMVF